MFSAGLKKEIISRLRKDILLSEGFRPAVPDSKGLTGISEIERVFPGGVFPSGAVHEFISTDAEGLASSAGFISGLLKFLMDKGGACLWIGGAGTIFPPALRFFGLEPHRVLFADLKRVKDILWATEEALKCGGLAAVVAEVQDISFAESRRLQLIVERSRVTGLLIRKDCRKISSTACTARWKVTHLPSEPEDGLPGVGAPRWQVELLKVRNGNPACWQMEWNVDRFALVKEKEIEILEERRARIA